MVRTDHPGVVDRLDQQPGQVHRLAVERAAAVQPGQQQHVLDQGGHPRGLLLDLAEGGADVVVVGAAARQLGVARDGGQRRAQLVRGVRDELADLLLAAVPGLEGGLHVGEQGVERGAHLADLGALVGEVLRHAFGEVDVALGQRQRGDRVRGGRHLGQRPELAAYEQQPAAGRQQCAERDQQRLPADQRGDGLVDLLGGQPGHLGAERPVHCDHPVVAEPRKVDLVHLPVDGYVGQDFEDLVGEILRLSSPGEQGAAAGGVADERPDRARTTAEVADPAHVARRRATRPGTLGPPRPPRMPAAACRSSSSWWVSCALSAAVAAAADQHRHEHHQRDDGEDQPRGERGEDVAHRLSPRA